MLAGQIITGSNLCSKAFKTGFLLSLPASQPARPANSASRRGM